MLVLDLDTTFAVPSVVVDGAAAPMTRRGGQLWIGLGRTRMPGTRIVATVRYEGAPRVAVRPPWDGGFTWASTADGRPWIATSCQTEGADLWWPVKDHPSDEADSMSISVAVPTGLVVASNGRLAGIDEGETLASDVPGAAPSGAWHTYRWKTHYPVNNYGIALNIAPYRVIEDTYESVTGETIPAVFYVLPERYDDALRQWPEFKAHVRFYEEAVGPYPWRRDKYGIAHTPHLGMEHQTINAYGSTFTDAPDGFDWLHHHEFGHEWWGNLVTASDWRDWWIHEGFCSYMQPLYVELATRGHRAAAVATAFRNAASGPARNRFDRRPTRAPAQSAEGNISDIYNKGALDPQRAPRRRWATRPSSAPCAAWPTRRPRPSARRNPARFASTDDLMRTASAIAGRDMAWFFEVYLRQPALPRLVETRTGARLSLRWDVPNGLPFPMPVEVEIDGTVRRIEMPGGAATVALPSASSRVTVDPSEWLLRVAE